MADIEALCESILEQIELRTGVVASSRTDAGRYRTPAQLRLARKRSQLQNVLEKAR